MTKWHQTLNACLLERLEPRANYPKVEQSNATIIDEGYKTFQGNSMGRRRNHQIICDDSKHIWGNGKGIWPSSLPKSLVGGVLKNDVGDLNNKWLNRMEGGIVGNWWKNEWRWWTMKTNHKPQSYTMVKRVTTVYETTRITSHSSSQATVTILGLAWNILTTTAQSCGLWGVYQIM